MTTKQAKAPAKRSKDTAGANDDNSSSGLTISQLLDQQIAQAIRPVLDEFRQQVTQELRQQSGGTPETGAAGSAEDKKSAAPQPTAPNLKATATQPARDVEEKVPQEVKVANRPPNGTGGAQNLLTQTLRPGLEAVEHQIEPMLSSALASIITALLAEGTRAAIQQQAESGLHGLLEKLFGALPAGAIDGQTRDKTEKLLQALLGEALDAIFSESVRTLTQQGSQQAIQASFHGDLGESFRQTGAMLKTITDALLGVLRRNQRNLVRLAIALAIMVMVGSLTSASGGEREREPHDNS